MNPFLVLAYGFLWLVFTAYAWSLSRRVARLKKEVEELKGRLGEQKPSDRRVD